MEDKLINITHDLVRQNFDLDEQELFVEEALAKRIEDLMNNNPVLLKSIFYRIDLNENKLGMALVSMQGPVLFKELAHQVIERLKKKAETRLKYSNYKSTT